MFLSGNTKHFKYLNFHTHPHINLKMNAIPIKIPKGSFGNLTK